MPEDDHAFLRGEIRGVTQLQTGFPDEDFRGLGGKESGDKEEGGGARHAQHCRAAGFPQNELCVREYEAMMIRAACTVFIGTLLRGQVPCERLTDLRLPGVTITSASTETMPSAHCRVTALVPPEVRIELWMPAEWNRKLLAVGNGGLAGSIPTDAMVKPLQRGYATSATDTGHTGATTNDGAWALGRYERIVDFADRAVHVMAEADKVIVQAFYGKAPVRSYFSGCSQGGHEALVEAQRYPADFDGIIAGDPANNWTRHYAGGHLWSAFAMEGEGYIPASKIALLAEAVNAECDALDGVKDGVLSDPRRCRLDPAKLQCAGEETATCLTAAQVSAVNKLWTGLRDAHGDQVYPGIVPGGEAGPGGWANWITGPAPGKSAHAKLGIPFYRYMVFDDANWDFRSFQFEPANGFDSDVDSTDAKLGALFNATSPDMTAFRGRGGKLIQYHGWSDPDITPLNSIQYYESVANFMARGGNHGLRDTKEFYRLFMVPGMQHCAGGPGATSFDMVEPLERWVENGVAPERVIAAHLNNGAVDRTRPLCAYPLEAQWSGRGSTDEASNFLCALPGRL
jgi:feruloyl esterase